MSVQLTFDDWYQRLNAATRCPRGQDMSKLVSEVYTEGAYKLKSHELRQACTVVLEEQCGQLTKPIKYFLERLRDSGIQPPYPKYIGLELFVVSADLSTSSAQIARNALRLIYEFVSQLREMNELQEHPRRRHLEQHADPVLSKCETLLFSRISINAPSREVIQLSLVPESDNSDELIFLRVLQGSELIFCAAKLLVLRASEAIEYGEVLDAASHLQWCVCLLDLLLPFLRLLSPISIESWHQLRPLIVQPSAIQSFNFHDFSAQLAELERILRHPRIPEWQLPHLPNCQLLLQQIVDKCRAWDKGHTAIATKYGRTAANSKPEGVQWLEKRQPPFSLTE